MSANTLLSRLEHVKQTGPRRWIARCPAHDDRGPSLSIRELEDGRVLVHDFGGCDVSEVVAAVGMELSELFPPRELGNYAKHRERRPFTADDALHCLALESTLLVIASADLAGGKPLSDADRARLILAATRINAAARSIHA